MKNMNLANKKIIFRFWAIIDLLYIFWYIGMSLYNNTIPYYNDITIALNTIENVGGPTIYIFGISSILLQLSLILSATLLFFINKYAKLLCYSQIPFRLLLVIPSIPFIFGSYLPTVLAIIWLITSEILKILSLKYAK